MHDEEAGDNAMMFLSGVLVENRTIDTVDIGMNWFGHMGASSIADALKVNTKGHL